MVRRFIGALVLLSVVVAAMLAIPEMRERLSPWLPSFLASMPDSLGKTANKSAPRAIPVRVTSATQRDVQIYLEGVGTVKARSTVAVKSQIEGQLIEALVHEGQTVFEGDVLFRLDPRPLKARLKEAEAALERDRVNHAKAIADVKRLTILSSQGYSPQTRLDDAQALVDTTQAASRASEAAVELVNLNLDYATIRAPINGRVGNLPVSVGNIVEANDTQPLIVIVETKPVYVSFGVPERYIDDLREKMTGTRLSVEVTTQASGTTVATGELFFINNVVDASNGTIELLAQFENPDERLIPGQFARARIQLSVLENAVLIPSRAIQINQDGRYVWVVNDDNTAELRAVVVGPEDDADTVISSGIDPGDRIVTDGQLRLYTGATVDPKNDKSKSNTTAQEG